MHWSGENYVHVWSPDSREDTRALDLDAPIFENWGLGHLNTPIQRQNMPAILDFCDKIHRLFPDNIRCLWQSTCVSSDWSVYCPYRTKKEKSQDTLLQDRTLGPRYRNTIYIVSDYTWVGQYIFTKGQWISVPGMSNRANHFQIAADCIPKKEAIYVFSLPETRFKITWWPASMCLYVA